jgi:hypothetical protein
VQLLVMARRQQQQQVVEGLQEWQVVLLRVQQVLGDRQR